MLTPNSKVSRSARVEANGTSLASFLSMLALDTPPLPVRILFENEGGFVLDDEYRQDADGVY